MRAVVALLVLVAACGGGGVTTDSGSTGGACSGAAAPCVGRTTCADGCQTGPACDGHHPTCSEQTTMATCSTVRPEVCQWTGSTCRSMSIEYLCSHQMTSLTCNGTGGCHWVDSGCFGTPAACSTYTASDCTSHLGCGGG